MRHYHHLTLTDREKATLLILKGFSISAVARILGRSPSTISRERRRNMCGGKYQYIPSIAQEKYEKRREKCHRRCQFVPQSPLFKEFKNKMAKYKWSPEQIVERRKLEGFPTVCYSTVYRAIAKKLFNTKHLGKGHGRGVELLRRKGRGRHPHIAPRIKNHFIGCNSLSERPAIVNQRGRIGDWEADTIIGKGGGPCLVTLVDRKTRYTIIARSPSKRTADVIPIIIHMLKDQPVYTITPDRGPEFEHYKELMAKFPNVTVYFPPAQHPQDRGTNENTNGLLREYFPRGKNFGEYSEEYIQKSMDDLNKRPRKCLNYRTPFEVYNNVVLHLI